MTDRELLELAAKAAGIVVIEQRSGGLPWTVERDGGRFPWEPITDDGDALRLAVKLQMRVSVGQVDWAAGSYVGVFEEISKADEEPHAATRRAIVRAAAAIGQSMEGEK